MLSKSRILVLVLMVPAALILSCQSAPEPISQAEMDRAQATLAPFKEELVDALMGSLNEGSPTESIQVCRSQAPEIAARLSVDGVRMGRTSHKTRNPANAPQPWVEPLLAEYLENPTDTRAKAVKIDESTLGYVEPIYVIPFCLSCHGPSIEPTLLDEIQSVYPEDRATDFKANDLRGLFWVTMPLSQESS